MLWLLYIVCYDSVVRSNFACQQILSSLRSLNGDVGLLCYISPAHRFDEHTRGTKEKVCYICSLDNCVPYFGVLAPLVRHALDN